MAKVETFSGMEMTQTTAKAEEAEAKQSGLRSDTTSRTDTVSKSDGSGSSAVANRTRVFIFLGFWQVIFIILFGVFVEYDSTALPSPNGTNPVDENPIGAFYPSKYLLT